jgi:hypothetical protein
MSDNEGVRLDKFAACADGKRRDVFDPVMSADEFDAFVREQLKVDDVLPSKALENAVDLIAEIRQAVVLFNAAYESDDGVDDDELTGDDGT